ncbi:MAG TPA: hypothetical protein VEC36_04010 [Patescibacteria group bacterium]|nr:hypothetical protein [Patescibacteria group bacterium]
MYNNRFFGSRISFRFSIEDESGSAAPKPPPRQNIVPNKYLKYNNSVLIKEALKLDELSVFKAAVCPSGIIIDSDSENLLLAVKRFE